MRSIRMTAIAALGAVLSLACGGGGGGTTSAPTATKATCTQRSVKIAVPVTPPNVVHIPPYVAQDLGYFKEENLDVEMVRFEGGVGAFRSVAAGSVDMAGTSSEPAILAISQGAEVKSVYTYAPNVDVSFVVGPSIKTGADLKGKKIGIQEPGGFADVMSRLVLKKFGLDPNKDVQMVQTTTAGRVTQLIAGQVDTGVLHVDQTLGIQKRSPGIHVLVNMWEVVSDYQYAFFAVSADKLKNDPATIECMVRALMRADRAIYDPSMKQRVTDIMVKYTMADPDIVAQTYNQLLAAKAWPQNEGIPKANVEGTIKSLKESNQLTKPVTFDQVVDLTIAKKVTAQLGRKDFPY